MSADTDVLQMARQQLALAAQHLDLDEGLALLDSVVRGGWVHPDPRA